MTITGVVIRFMSTTGKTREQLQPELEEMPSSVNMDNRDYCDNDFHEHYR